jgi:diguanylate cyclase (GGDEF)-like protein
VEAVLQRCIELDSAARDTYGRLAELCTDPDLKETFVRMAADEWAHVEWRTELRDAFAAGRVPPLADEDALSAAVEETATSVGALLQTDLTTLDTDGMLELAIRMEFFMLDPAFGELLELLDPGSSLHHREAYSLHVMRLVGAIENRHGDSGLASFLARVLRRTFRDQERLARLATRDQLTGLLNRRGIYNYLVQWCAWSQRYGRSLGVLLVDVDRFKAVNDAFGHPIGDAALRAVARALKQAVRESDLVGRYGGDEFAVLAPEASPEAISALAERMLSEVRETELGGALTGTRITVSIGCAYLLQGAKATPEALLSCADRSLYAAKAAGRDRAGQPCDVNENPARVDQASGPR